MSPSNEPQLRDLRTRPRRLQIQVEASPIYDLLLALWTLGAEDKVETHELGLEWFDQFRRMISVATRQQMAEIGAESGMVWLSLLGLIHLAPDRRPEGVIDWVARAEARLLRRRLLEEKCRDCDPALLEQATAGNEVAVEAVLKTGHLAEVPEPTQASIRAFLLAPAASLGPSLASILDGVRRQAFLPFEQSWGSPLEASAEATRALSATLGPEELIDQVTKGIAFDLESGTERLVLAPSVVLRPWTIVTEAREAVIVCYPVADEHLDADPEAPPSWLVRTYKALADEKRLRMLRRLGEGEASLGELTELLGLAKSTVHHHLGVLRSAGLVRVRLFHDHDKNPVYTLRGEGVPEAVRLLDSYLQPSKGATR